MTDREDLYTSLWITRFTRFSGIATLAERLGRPRVAPYAFVTLVLVIDAGVLSTIGYLTADRLHPLLESPFWYLAPFGLWFCVWVIRRYAGNYATLSETYDSTDFDTDDANKNIPYDIRRTRLKHGIFLLLVAVHIITYLVRGNWTMVVELEGPIIGFIKYAIIIPFGYFPVIAELAGITIACFLMVPRYFVQHQYRLQFDDPLDIGGLEEIGNLIKRAFYVYSLGLLILLAWVYGPSVFASFAGSAYESPGTVESVQFILAWVLGMTFLLYGVFKLHLYMQRQKRARIEDIDTRIRELGTNENRVPGTEITEEDKTKLDILHLELEEVRNTRTWPFSAEAQERVIFSALFPIVIDRLINLALI